MNARVIPVALVCVLLANCGGGGGAAGSSVVPVQAGGNAPQLVKFAFKVPVKAKQVVRKKMIGGKYVSPATVGLGISFSTTATTFTPAQLTTPSVAVDLSSCVSSTVGVASITCATNADGSQTFTATMPLPPGTYAFEVVTWDSPPKGTPLGFVGNQLSNALTSVIVTSGAAVPSPNFVLNAIPASLVLTAAPGQNHVTSSGSALSITGNAPQQFFLNALDADGFIITGSGAPTISLTDATGSFAFAQNASNPNVTNEWSINALQPALQNTNGVSISLNAAAPGAATPVTSKTTIVPIPELWLTIGASNVVQGYPMTVVTGAAPSASLGNNGPFEQFTVGANAGPLAIDNAGNLWVAQGSAVQEYNAPTFSTVPSANSNFFNDPCNGAPTSLALDANGYIVVTDPTCSGGTVAAYNGASLSSGAMYQLNAKAQSSLGGAMSVSVAPNDSAVQAFGLQNQLFVGSNNGSQFSIDLLSSTTNAVSDTTPNALTPATLGPSNAVGVASDGNAWYYDGANLNVAPLLANGINKTPLGSTATTTTASQFAADPAGGMWVPAQSGSSPFIYYYIMGYGWNGTTVVVRSSVNVSNPVTGVYIAP